MFIFILHDTLELFEFIDIISHDIFFYSKVNIIELEAMKSKWREFMEP